MLRHLNAAVGLQARYLLHFNTPSVSYFGPSILGCSRKIVHFEKLRHKVCNFPKLTLNKKLEICLEVENKKAILESNASKFEFQWNNCISPEKNRIPK